MEYIHIKKEDDLIKCFFTNEERPVMTNFPANELGKKSWKMCLEDWEKHLIEVKWNSKQDEIKTCIKLRKENEPSEPLEEYLKSDYHEVTSLVDLDETDCKFPACTCTPSKCKERGFVVKFKESKMQEDLWMEISNRIYNDSNEWTKIKQEFEIKRK